MCRGLGHIQCNPPLQSPTEGARRRWRRRRLPHRPPRLSRAAQRAAARSGATQHALGCSSGPAGQRQREGAPGKGRPGVKALFSAHAPASSASQLASTAAREHLMCTQHARPCRSAPASVRTGLCAGPGSKFTVRGSGSLQWSL